MKTGTLLVGIFLLLLAIAAALAVFQRLRTPERWAVYYHGNLPYEDFFSYNVVAFDSDAFPAFSGKRKRGQVILGYLSTSEAEEYRSYYADIEQMDVLLDPSNLWAAHHAIDIRKPQWQDYFVNRLVPSVLAKGFDGIMLDTIDTALWLEEVDPQRFAGMKTAAVQLIKTIHAQHPAALLMLNRGFGVLPDVAQDINYALAESIFLRYMPHEDSSDYFPQTVYDELTSVLKNAQKKNPKLKVVTLDYVPTTNPSTAMVKQVYATQRRNGFVPYVTTYDLGNRHEEPL